MARISRCCICGKTIINEVTEGNNPDPLKDETGKFLSEGDNPYCCKHCDNTLVTPYRICQLYHVDDQCSKIQNKVLKMRKEWHK